MQFKRDIPLNRWIGVVKDNLEQARKAGLITRDVEQRVGDSLAGLVRRAQGPRLREGRPADLRGHARLGPQRRRLEGRPGASSIASTRATPGRRVVLGSYFATGSEFREPLLKSMFESAH